MSQLLEDFVEILKSEDRGRALAFIMGLLERKEMDFIEIYEDILTPSLNEMISSGNEEIDIWNEHIRTSIIKTIVENIYPYVMEKRGDSHRIDKKFVAVFCPAEEYHTLGARMTTDIFTYMGFSAIFVGGNTPFSVLMAGMKSRKIDYIAISVSNSYHIVATRDLIATIRQMDKDVKIIVGGNAFIRLKDPCNRLGANYIVNSFRDLMEIDYREGGTDHETGL